MQDFVVFFQIVNYNTAKKASTEIKIMMQNTRKASGLILLSRL